MDWRKIEQALVEIAKDDDMQIRTELGDYCVNPRENTVNLSQLAKELAERLK